MKLQYLGLVLASFGSMLPHASASAASFDCVHAKAAREKLICGDPELSQLDNQLGQIYQERRVLLSPEGARMLQHSETSWLHFITQICSLAEAKNTDGRDDPKSCLQQQYKERLTELGNVGKKFGPYLFNRIDLYAAEPDDDDTGSAPGFYIQHIAYPQIDRPDSPSVVAWNTQAVKRLAENDECDGIPADTDVDFDVGYATERMISVSWSNSSYCHGTAHGSGFEEVANIVLQPVPHTLTGDDLFGTGEGWQEKLQTLFWNALLLKGWKPPSPQDDGLESGLKEDFIKPERWLFTAEGLQVSFNAYEGGCYACNPGPVMVPWSELKPLMASPAMAP